MAGFGAQQATQRRRTQRVGRAFDRTRARRCTFPRRPTTLEIVQTGSLRGTTPRLGAYK
jgi:hypothetical protein